MGLSAQDIGALADRRSDQRDAVTTTQPVAKSNASHPLLARSVQLRVYIMLRKIIDRTRMTALREDHLSWVLGQERAGTLFMAGPTKTCGGEIILDGLMVFRAGSSDQAAKIAAQDPYVLAGVMTFEICEWSIVEGCLPLTLRLSDSSLEFI